MFRTSRQLRSLSLAAALFTVGLAACDDDPAAPGPPELDLEVASDSVISRQGSLRVRFGGVVDTASALNPENFVVINQCTGLRVPGALRLSGDTVVFSPSQALPFLTLLSVRVQNVLDVRGRPLTEPFTFSARTETPAVSDVTWEALNSPTNEAVNGVTFVDRSLGYMSTVSAAVYRTTNGGQNFQAVFKDNTISAGRAIRAISADSIYFTAARSGLGGVVLRSANGGQTFQQVYGGQGLTFRGLTVFERSGGLRPLLFVAGNQGTLATFRIDDETGGVVQFGPVGGLQFGEHGALSRDTIHAVAVGTVTNSLFTVENGVAYRSVDGGRTFTSVALPPGLPALRGSGFSGASTALLVGDTSTVVSLNVATGVPTRLGAANGIPQTTIDTATNRITVYNFQRAEFAPDAPNIGWIIGAVVRRQPGVPDVRQGIILMTRDGGATFTRQAVRGAGENGLGFPALRDISVLGREFASISGENGFVAARKADIQEFNQVCTFSNPD